MTRCFPSSRFQISLKVGTVSIINVVRLFSIFFFILSSSSFSSEYSILVILSFPYIFYVIIISKTNLAYCTDNTMYHGFQKPLVKVEFYFNLN